MTKKKVRRFIPDLIIKEDDCKNFSYFKEEDLPILVLGVPYKFQFTKERKFIKIAHQTAGILCHQRYIVGTVLKPKPKVLEAMKFISDFWLEKESIFGFGLNEIFEYRKQLNAKLGVDCDNSFRDFEEGIYPIDVTKASLKKLTTEKIDDPSKFIAKKYILWPNWKLYIIGKNSD